MANENENKSAPEEKKHESWLEEALEKLDTDFPLSGGETDEDLEAATEVDEDDDSDEDTDEPKSKGDGKSWIEDVNVDTDFPLSGGEEEDK